MTEILKVIEVIPFRSFKEKIKIVQQHEGKGKIEIYDNIVYIERTEKGADNLDLIKSYNDLCEEIEIWKWRIEAYKAEIEALKKLARFDGPSDISAIDYSQPSIQTSGQLGFEEALIRLQKIDSHILLHTETIKKLEKAKRQMEERIEKLEGLDRKVVYMRDALNKPLTEIAEELGYSYQYIKEISSRNKKPTNNLQTR